MQSDHEFKSLYEGADGEALMDGAPYLVQLPSDSHLLERLIKTQAGKTTGVFF